MVGNQYYGKYAKLRNASWQVLLDFKVISLPTKVIPLANQMSVEVVKNSDALILCATELGKCIIRENRWRIVYDDIQAPDICHMVIAHELAHILLGHQLGQDRIAQVFQHKPEEERAADMLALRLLAPACVLWGLELHTAQDIATVCNLPLRYATERAKRMEVLFKRGKFLSSKLEQEVYEQFRPWVEANKNAHHRK